MNRTAFRNKFAVDGKWHSFKLTSYGCFQRHTTPKSEQYLTPNENARASRARVWSRADLEEQTVLYNLRALANQGITDLQKGESVEHFINRHSNEV